jgi:hypothetical protein
MLELSLLPSDCLAHFDEFRGEPSGIRVDVTPQHGSSYLYDPGCTSSIVHPASAGTFPVAEVRALMVADEVTNPSPLPNSLLTGKRHGISSNPLTS